MRIARALIIVVASLLWLRADTVAAAETNPSWQTEWDNTVEATKIIDITNLPLGN